MASTTCEWLALTGFLSLFMHANFIESDATVGLRNRTRSSIALMTRPGRKPVLARVGHFPDFSPAASTSPDRADMAMVGFSMASDTWRGGSRRTEPMAIGNRPSDPATDTGANDFVLQRDQRWLSQ